jgi:hypothetical protein
MVLLINFAVVFFKCIDLDTTISMTDLSRRQKRLHNSDMNLTVNNPTYANLFDWNKIKRSKANKQRLLPESSSLISLPSAFSPCTSTNDSSTTLVNSNHPFAFAVKRHIPDETAADADDEKDVRDESINPTRIHRYHHQLSSSSHHRLQGVAMTSEDDDDELLTRNHHGMMDFMDRVSAPDRLCTLTSSYQRLFQQIDAFDQEESLTAALQAEQERTIASLIAEQEDLEEQLNNVSDDDLLVGEDGSELEESELSVRIDDHWP